MAFAADGVERPAFALNVKAPAQTLIKNVNIFDGKRDTLTMGMNVLVENNLIKNISNEPIQAAAKATIIDGGGRTLMPGLIDSHVWPSPHVHFNMAIEGGLKEIEAS